LAILLYIAFELSFAGWQVVNIGEEMPRFFVVIFTAGKLGLFPFVLCALRARAPSRVWLAQETSGIPFLRSAI
jgi:hypothetical protein